LGTNKSREEKERKLKKGKGNLSLVPSWNNRDRVQTSILLWGLSPVQQAVMMIGMTILMTF